MKRRFSYISLLIISGLLVADHVLNAGYSTAAESKTAAAETTAQAAADTVGKPRYPVAKTSPETYKDVTEQHPIDLKTPENVHSEIEYNPKTNRYLLRTKIGDMEVVTPFSMTREEYLDYHAQQSLYQYFLQKNREEVANEGKRDKISPFDMQFDLGPADKIFGPGGVRLQTQGTAEIKFGVKHTNTENPALPENIRSKTFFDFDSQINLSVNAKVGDKINFAMNYNTDAVFDFDSKQLKLAYQGKEDEIIKTLEAGNVSMNTSNSLIRGGAALFGIKTELQFGKLRVGAIVSQQESESKSVSSKGGVQTTPFEFSADQYDENRHFFLAHYFRDHYNEAMSTLPFIKSAITINRMEVWVTNKRGSYDEARNMVAFTDLAEHDSISMPNISPDISAPPIPYNKVNNLYTTLTNYPDVRNISTVTQILEGLGFQGGDHYEKIESARKLNTSEYTYNAQLGYISLRTMLQPDEVLAVAFEYTYQGKVYQVGEFSTDNPENTNSNLFLKLLKGTALSPSSPYWHLMMKNIYSLNVYSLQQEKFRLDITYQSDTTGVYMNYLTEGDIANQILLRVMNLDRLDSRQNPYSDGFFDFVEGYTISSQNGRIIFPVLEPFGSHLRTKINNDNIANKYVFQELYDSTLTVAKQVAEKNKFRLSGEYKASSNSEIQLGAMNVAPGSVRVTANGMTLTEGSDYTVNYTAGTVTIVNQSLIDANVPINVSLESQSFYGMQRKTMLGMDVNYEFSKNFNLGATIMHLRETPLTTKTNMGEESVRNTLWGFNTAFRTESQWLTNLIDKLPLLDLTAPSQINFSAEFAQLVPGHYESEYGGKYSYIDDFERTKISYNLRDPYGWHLSATPYDNGVNPLFPEAGLVSDVQYGKNRALLAWYQIESLFTYRNSSLTPEHIKQDKDQLSNHYMREVTEYELFPNKEQVYGEPITVPVFNMAFYPQERGPYNVIADFNSDGTLRNPEQRWGGIYRKMDNPDFESSNIEYIEFWLMDPYLYRPDSKGGDLYINLGEVSEDILKDERKFAESAMPIDGDQSQLETTVWGKMPKRQSLIYAFDNTPGARKYQDVGLNGLRTEEEFEHSTYKDYLAAADAQLSPAARASMQQDPFSFYNDPAGDNYHYFRGSDYDQAQLSILERYKKYNGLEGNSRASEDSPESYDTSGKLTPDVEDANQDFTMNENEKYFQYRIPLIPDSLTEGRGYITAVHRTEITLRNGNREPVVWYQFKIPIGRYQKRVGNIKDFKSIRFMRMFMTNFREPVVLRFGTLELVRGEWRTYTQDLSDPNRVPPAVKGVITATAVNIEENSDRQPVNYVLPPGVSRVIDPGQPQIRQQNEQALSLAISDLASGDARAVYKNTTLDMRQYKRIQMFSHAEKLIDDATNLQNNEISVFLRLGSDYKQNYYEYEVPLTLTPSGRYSTYNISDQEIVWPESNMIDFSFELLTNLKLERNREKRKENSAVTFFTPYTSYDPNKPMNKISVVGNPSLSEVKTIMIGIRNNSMEVKSIIIWVNELRLTDFDESGGWATNANLNVNLSDLATVNLGGRIETAGFGALDQGVMERSIDDFYQYNVATTVQLGKLFPKDKVTAPLYYSYSEQITSPKYNPLDQDILLKDALDNLATNTEKDSIRNASQTKITTKSFNLTNVKVNVSGKNPMPWDPSNLTMAYSFSESRMQNPTTEYERNVDQRGNLTYSYSPFVTSWKPFKNTGSKSATANFAKEIELGFLPSNISLLTNMSRTYYEVQIRDLSGFGANQIPASFRQEFYWDRGMSLNWNLTKNLNFSLKTGTEAIIEEPHKQVNKHLNPDAYEIWKDSVWLSIKGLGTPLQYSQTFNATYNVPLKAIPALSWVSSLSATYSATYNWDKGAVLLNSDEEFGNTIRNQRQIEVNGSLQMTTLYNRSNFLKEVNKKFTMKRPSTATGSNRNNTAQKTAKAKPEPRKFEKDITLSNDSATIVTHNLKNKKVIVSAKDSEGKRYRLMFKAINENQIRIQTKDSVSIRLTVIQGPKPEDNWLYQVAQHAAYGMMMLRSATITYRLTDGMMLPGFRPSVGDIFGQKTSDDGYAPGLDFAFGFAGQSYIDRAKERDWLVINSGGNINPAMLSHSKDLNIKAVLEPVVGMKIDLTGKRLSTKTTSIQFMYDGMPEQQGGTFTMSTAAIRTSFESSNAADGYRSTAFDQFLTNRGVITNRLQQRYARTSYPATGFIKDEFPALAGMPYQASNGQINQNSADVLVPAFLSAYTGQNAGSMEISAFPSLKSLLPNWRITYEGLIQLDLLSKHFKSFILTHNYVCLYTVGNYSSFLSWAQAPESDGLGFTRDALSGNIMPSSPYDISMVNITENFSPLIGLDATFKNNMSFKLEWKNMRNVNLNISSYQIVESKSNEAVIGMGYKITQFNKVLRMKATGSQNFSNDLTVRADFVYRKQQALIHKIEDAFTQPTSGSIVTTLKMSADYNLSKALTLRAFFDKDMNRPLVSSSAYPTSNTNAGISVRLNLTR
jgi:cell surface protein SprA